MGVVAEIGGNSVCTGKIYGRCFQYRCDKADLYKDYSHSTIWLLIIVILFKLQEVNQTPPGCYFAP